MCCHLPPSNSDLITFCTCLHLSTYICSCLHLFAPVCTCQHIYGPAHTCQLCCLSARRLLPAFPASSHTPGNVTNARLLPAREGQMERKRGEEGKLSDRGEWGCRTQWWHGTVLSPCVTCSPTGGAAVSGTGRGRGGGGVCGGRRPRKVSGASSLLIRWLWSSCKCISSKDHRSDE